MLRNAALVALLAMGSACDGDEKPAGGGDAGPGDAGGDAGVDAGTLASTQPVPHCGHIGEASPTCQ